MENKMTPTPWTSDGCQVHAKGKYLLAAQSGSSLEEDKANSIAIVSAVNNTYGKGINPEAVQDLLECLKNIVSVAVDRWRPLPATSYEKNCLSSARAAIEKATIK